MDSADEMRAGHGDFEAEVSLAVGFGGAAYVHAIGEVDEEDFVACSGLVGGAVGDGAGEVESCAKQEARASERMAASRADFASLVKRTPCCADRLAISGSAKKLVLHRPCDRQSRTTNIHRPV